MTEDEVFSWIPFSVAGICVCFPVVVFFFFLGGGIYIYIYIERQRKEEEKNVFIASSVATVRTNCRQMVSTKKCINKSIMV